LLAKFPKCPKVVEVWQCDGKYKFGNDRALHKNIFFFKMVPYIHELGIAQKY